MYLLTSTCLRRATHRLSGPTGALGGHLRGTSPGGHCYPATWHYGYLSTRMAGYRQKSSLSADCRLYLQSLT